MVGRIVVYRSAEHVRACSQVYNVGGLELGETLPQLLAVQKIALPEHRGSRCEPGWGTIKVEGVVPTSPVELGNKI
jgi:hypothetical protein